MAIGVFAGGGRTIVQSTALFSLACAAGDQHPCLPQQPGPEPPNLGPRLVITARSTRGLQG